MPRTFGNLTDVLIVEQATYLSLRDLVLLSSTSSNIKEILQDKHHDRVLWQEKFKARFIDATDTNVPASYQEAFRLRHEQYQHATTNNILLRHADAALKHDKAFVLANVSSNPIALRYIPGALVQATLNHIILSGPNKDISVAYLFTIASEGIALLRANNHQLANLINKKP